MAASQVPKYQTIYNVLRQRILDGEYPAGSKLPAQQGLADAFGVNLMTLRQAITELKSDGLVWAERGRGTFVVEHPIDIRLGNLSSFAQQMRAAGVEMKTELLGVTVIQSGSNNPAFEALKTDAELCRITRRRMVAGAPFSLQRSYLARSLGVAEPGMAFIADSLYDEIESKTGWTVARAKESVTAVLLSDTDAGRLEADAKSEPAVLSIRTSINQFGNPFLYDEALLLGGRCIIDADRTAQRLSLHYGLAGLD